ncbi:MAG: hypothetical protein A07HN63_01552 [uncultured archaeon A07HN63]|nr:MAG: hypothetical protein A07HN63_01552 [uncultured archaeon A07HN63]
MVVLSLEGGFALASFLVECRFGFVVKLGRLVSVTAGLQFGLDVLVVGLLDRLLGVVFDLGLGLLADLEIADAGLDSRGKALPTPSTSLSSP